MSESMALSDISMVIESTLCKLEIENEGTFTDKTAGKLLELYFDEFHFKDSDINFSNTTQRDQFLQILQILKQDLANIPEEQLVKVMATVYRSILRRTNGGREYLQFAQQYVGARVAQGARMITP